jgi:hypothetical protein
MSDNLNSVQLAKDDANFVIYNQTIYPVKTAFSNPAASGDNVVVAAVAGKKVLIIEYDLIANGAVNAFFKDGSSAISSTKYLVANTGIARPSRRILFGNAAVNTAININLSAAIAVGVQVWYIEV